MPDFSNTMQSYCFFFELRKFIYLSDNKIGFLYQQKAEKSKKIHFLFAYFKNYQ